MKPIFLTTGPSKLYPAVEGFLQDAYQSGILSRSHRSAEFSELYQSTLNCFREKLHLPNDYYLFFLTSATECWSVIAEGLVSKRSLHYFSGAFGQRWFLHTNELTGKAQSASFKPMEFSERLFELFDFQTDDLICLTHNETSNGSQVPFTFLEKLRALAPNSVLAVDVTSSFGAITTPFPLADVWFASVQKCLGLPSGLAVMFCSPRAIERMLEVNFNQRYNALQYIYQNALKFQPTHTPNTLDIYLLNRILSTLEPIERISARIENRAQNFYAHYQPLMGVFCKHIGPQHLISDTVFCMEMDEDLNENVSDLKARLAANGYIVASGYGTLKETTFRVANFPAVTDEELNGFKNLIAEWYPN